MRTHPQARMHERARTRAHILSHTKDDLMQNHQEGEKRCFKYCQREWWIESRMLNTTFSDLRQGYAIYCNIRNFASLYTADLYISYRLS